MAVERIILPRWRIHVLLGNTALHRFAYAGLLTWRDMGIFKNKKYHKRELGTQSIPERPSPKWVNPTAVVLALRNPDGTLDPISIDSIADMEKSRIVEIASAVVGTQYAVLRELFNMRENIVLTVQSEEAMVKEEARQVAARLANVEKKRERKQRAPIPKPKAKRAPKVVKKKR